MSAPEAAAPLLMIPGPTPAHPDVLAALAEPVRSHTSAENAAAMRAIAAGIRACVGDADARVYTVAGSGTLAMEMAVVNHARSGDRVVVCSHGAFGARFAEIATAHGMSVTVVAAEWGEHVDPAELRRACATGPAPSLVTVTHVDTSSGTLARAADLAAAARGSGAVLVLDGVCATGGIAQSMREWGYDVVLTGAQKALGVPPGLAILAVSERARARRADIERIHAYYADLKRWDPAVDDPTVYFSTHPTSMVRALAASVELVLAEGLEARFARHERLAQRTRSAFAGLGFEPLTDTSCLAPTLSVLAVPPGVDAGRLRAAMLERGVLVGACGGPFAGRGIRVAHMGTVGEAELDRTLEAARAALEEAGAPA